MNNPSLEELRAISGENYNLNVWVQQQLGHVAAVIVIAPFETGKTHVTSELHPQDFTIVRGFTDRDKRPEETVESFEFLQRSDATTATVLEDARMGQYVQVTVHPNGTIYGSRPEAYGPRSVLTPIASEVPGMRNRGFRNVNVFSLTAHQPVYDNRLKEKFSRVGPMSEKSFNDFMGRLREGMSNLLFSLEQPDSLWIPNCTGKAHGKLASGLLTQLGMLSMPQAELAQYIRQDPDLYREHNHGYDLASKQLEVLERWHRKLS